MPTLAVATSDWHLAKSAWRNRAVFFDSYASLRQIVDFALGQGAMVLAAGDLYDSDDPDPATVREMQCQIARLERAAVPIFHTTGQHDRHNAGNWLEISDWPVRLHRQFVRRRAGRHELALYGWDWVPAASLQDEIDRIPSEVSENPHGICLSHQVYSEFLRFDGAAEGSLGQIPGVCTLAVGDYHGVVGDGSSRSLRVGDHLVLSPGSIALQSVDEPEDKSFWVLEQDDDTGALYWRLEPLRTRAVAKYRIANDADLAALPDVLERWLADYEVSGRKDELPPELHRPIVAVWFPEELTATPSDLQRFRDVVHLFLKPISRRRAEREIAARAALRPASGATLLGSLGEVLPAGDPLRPDVERLLAAKDQPAELAAIRAEFLAGGD